MTLRKKLILAFLLLGLAPTAVLGILAAYGSFAVAERSARKDAEQTLGDLFTEIQSDVNSAAVLERRQAVEFSQFPPQLSRGSFQDLALHNVHVVRLFNRQPYAALRLTLLHPRFDEALVMEGVLRNLPSDVVITGAWRRPDPDLAPELRDVVETTRRADAGPVVRTLFRPRGPVLALGIPWRTLAERQPGALVEEIDVPTLLEHVTGKTPGCRAGECFIAGGGTTAGALRFLYHTDPALIGLPVDPAAGIARPAAGRPAPGFLFTTRRGTLTAVGVEPSTGWLFGAVLALAPYQAPVRTGVLMGLGLFLLTAVLVIAGIALVTRGIGGAVDEIVASAGAIARGDFGRTVGTRRTDEFGAIAAHINEMAQDLALSAESRSIARFSSRLVHELKGVASQMNLLLYNLRENYDDPEFRAEFPGLMEQLVKHVESLALQLKRGRTDDAAPTGPVDLDGLVSRIVEDRRRALPPGIRVALELRAGGPAATNEEILASVIENLVSNAVEAMEDGGVLTVRTGPLDAAAHGRPIGAPTHFVEVEDMGRGMSREFIETQLFEPFATTKAKGLGLGMYQVRRDIARLGGRIDVQSRPGHGTCVRVEVGSP